MVLQQYKIVFGGSVGSGKSAAIKTLSDISVIETEAINTDLNRHSKYFTTVGIDYGEILLEDNTKIGLYGTPGQDRFDFIWPIVCKGALGVAILIDHSRQQRLQDLQTYIDAFQGYCENIVIGITHLDKQVDQLLKIYRDWMSLHHYSYPLFAVDARQKDDVLLLVEVLITTIETHSIEMI
jgi:signal recognition particle receptor subunit beta